MAEPLKMQFGSDAPRHDPGTHRVEILVNGRAYPAGTFTVIRSARSTASKRP